MGNNNVKHHGVPLSENVVLLKDVFCTQNNDVEKQKLVHLYPDGLSWTSTHLTCPIKYSQFRYKLLLETLGVVLIIETLHVEQETNNLYLDEQLWCANFVGKHRRIGGF